MYLCVSICVCRPPLIASPSSPSLLPSSLPILSAVRHHLPPPHLRLVRCLPSDQAWFYPDLSHPDLCPHLVHQRLYLCSALQTTGRQKLDMEHRYCCACLPWPPCRGVVVLELGGMEPGIDCCSAGGDDLYYFGLVFVCLVSVECGGRDCGAEYGWGV